MLKHFDCINTITESDIEHMESNVGPFYFVDKKRLNEAFFANMYLKYENCLFDCQKKSFYLYEPETGLWRARETEFIKEQIADFTRCFCKQQGLYMLLSCITNQFTRNCVEIAKGIVGVKDPFFDSKGDFKVHCQSGVLEISPENQSWFLRGFSPDDLSRNRTEISYDPEAGIPNRFLNELLKPVLTADEIDILQMYVGQCLLGVNYSQKFLLITGAAGTGKSTLVEVIKKLVNPENATEFRAEHLSSRFEIGRYYDMTLLLGSDVSENFLNAKGIGNLKKLTGHDTLTGEDKGSNQKINIKGDFNVVITSNSLPAIRMENDSDAWLNWALQGAKKVIQSRGEITLTEEHKKRIEDLLLESDSVAQFVNDRIYKNDGGHVLIDSIFTRYVVYCKERNWNVVPKAKMEREAKSLIEQNFYVTESNDLQSIAGTSVRGYRGISMKLW